MKKKKEKVFMVCDWDDGKARGAAFDIGIVVNRFQNFVSLSVERNYLKMGCS